MSTGSAPSDLSPLSPLLPVNAAALTETLLYGIHFVLFCICMFLLIRERRSTHSQWFILGFAFIMFALSTADISISIRVMTHGLTTQGYCLKCAYPKIPIFLTNNFIAELILLYRCYMIWGRSKYLLATTGLLVLADTILGYFCLSIFSPPLMLKYYPVYGWSVFAINIFITLIATARIFWISEMARPILEHQLRRRFLFVIAILIESSAVYSVCLFICLLFPWDPKSQYRLVPAAIAMRVVAIMPTLLVVQVGLDRVVRESDTSDCERPGTSVILDTIVSDDNHAETRDPPNY